AGPEFSRPDQWGGAWSDRNRDWSCWALFHDGDLGVGTHKSVVRTGSKTAPHAKVDAIAHAKSADETRERNGRPEVVFGRRMGHRGVPCAFRVVDRRIGPLQADLDPAFAERHRLAKLAKS